MRHTLAVVGAGPKGLAVAAKAAALRSAGFAVPEVVLIDRHGVAAHWSGAVGYTDGRQRLGTPPEKDVGFPYAPSWERHSAAVDRAMQRLSWQAYLTREGSFADWVDRRRPQPTHRQWAQYLGWVAAEVGVRPQVGELAGVELEEGRWRLELADGRGDRRHLLADGLVLTGPGDAIQVPGQPRGHPRILDGRSFWLEAEALAMAGPAEVCVIGSGETAGSVASALLDLLPDGSLVELVSSHGVLYSRGESFTENRYYSDPGAGWARLAERHRREFLKRTDRGVFSVQVERVLDQAESVRTVAGRVTGLQPAEAKVMVEIAYQDQRECVPFDFVVVAIGFDPCWFLPLLGERASGSLAGALGWHEDGPPSRAALERAVGHDLAVEGLLPRLHLPVLAGVAQGPGFPNLSCLGLLADRVLHPHVTPPEARTARSGHHGEMLERPGSWGGSGGSGLPPE